MDTNEHTQLGNELRFKFWTELQGNPYVTFDEEGTMHLNMQGITEKGMPEHIELTIPSGVILGMSGDYFGGAEVDMELPSQYDFDHSNQDKSNTADQCQTLGDYLINSPITDTEEQKLIRSYQKLANKTVTNQDIDTIYTINSAKYLPFSSTLNSYVQQIMFALRIKNYGETLLRNLSHFTPWSVRVYILGHHIALKYARISHELNQFMSNPEYTSTNEDFNTLIAILKQNKEDGLAEKLKDLSYRYQALALGMELFSFHYYSDHFAAGHGAFMGDLRVLLPQRFGTLGSVLVNNLHDELNTVTVYTKRPYDPTPNPSEPPVQAGGDGDFDSDRNYYNRLACIAGMEHSLNDLHQVFNGQEIPKQSQYGGLEHLPDVDTKYRQPQPLFLLGEDNKIYYRSALSKIRTLAPSEFKATYAAPQDHGYTELTNRFQVFILVIKLRLLAYFYEGKLQPSTAEELKKIEQEEAELNPGRQPIPATPAQHPAPVHTPFALPKWNTPKSLTEVMCGLRKHNMFAAHQEPASVPPEQKADGYTYWGV